jgi:hypothetical protein
MKVLFLDIDGVLVTVRSHVALGTGKQMRAFDPVGLAFVRKIAEQGVRVVISSIWRFHNTKADMEALLGFELHPHWRTADLRSFDGAGRAEEIHTWVADHHDVEKYAVLDDMRCPLVGVYYWVEVDGLAGISCCNYRELEEILDLKE